MTQAERVLSYIMEKGSVTSLEAFNVLGVTRLSARIHDIRHKMGIPVKTENINVKNRFGESCTVARYSL